MNWQPKETMPMRDAQFLAAVRVYSAHTGKFLHWGVDYITVDEDGDVEEYSGWDLSDYELWCPIPELPDPETLDGDKT